MHSIHSHKLTLLLVGIIVVEFFVIITLLFQFDSARRFYVGSAVLANSTASESQATQSPILLTIPRINVTATVKSVGVLPSGAMDVPKNPNDVAWFNLGPRPGDAGSAVISGHFGWKNGIPAVFDNLDTLQKGDKLYVEDNKGSVITFVVRESRTFGENQDATEVFSSDDGGAHLNLITCQGIWNRDKKSYSERLVVFTDKESI